MSARTPFTFTDNPGFDYDAGSNEGHLLDMNTTGSSLECMDQYDIDANVYGLATEVPNVPPPRPAPTPFPTVPHQSDVSRSATGIEDCFEVTSLAASMNYPTTTVANTRACERVAAAVEPFQGGLNVCYVCDSLLTEQATLAAVPDQQCLSLRPGYLQEIAFSCASINEENTGDWTSANLSSPNHFTGMQPPLHNFQYDLQSGFPDRLAHRELPIDAPAEERKILEPVKPVVTRQNSYYLCFERAVKLQSAVNAYANHYIKRVRDEDTYAQSRGNKLPDAQPWMRSDGLSAADWAVITEYIDALKPLKATVVNKQVKSQSSLYR
ncbi:hypothetical protein L13192_09498 [Pyrenophora tritici-repentis]|nr:hypothetical protein L13192_09498 [Pyrenophora tritici-repentis]